MSRSQSLCHNMINQITGNMARDHIPSPLPSQSVLTEMYNISRTTVCRVLSHLGEYGVPTQIGDYCVIVRKPDHDDDFTCTTAPMTEQNRILEQASFTMINQRQLRVGESFSELQLARAADVSPAVVQEYLSEFERYDLIKSEKHGQWDIKQSDQACAEQLFELREVPETHFLQHFLNLPGDGPRWLQVKTLLERHRVLRDNTSSSFHVFSQLGRKSHVLLFPATDNVPFNQLPEIISVIFHSHHQRDESDLKQRNIIAIDEHMTILSTLICRSDLDIILVFCSHSNPAKQSVTRSISQGCNVAH